VAALADEPAKPQWQIPAKLVHGLGGSQGVVLVGADRVVYESSRHGESRTWRIEDLENVSSSGEFDLTITTHEREFRFQLKHAIGEKRYQELWMRVNRARGNPGVVFCFQRGKTPLMRRSLLPLAALRAL
jgi:hypothetical protein